jgi:hypothetical protein
VRKRACLGLNLAPRSCFVQPGIQVHGLLVDCPFCSVHPGSSIAKNQARGCKFEIGQAPGVTEPLLLVGGEAGVLPHCSIPLAAAPHLMAVRLCREAGLGERSLGVLVLAGAGVGGQQFQPKPPRHWTSPLPRRAVLPFLHALLLADILRRVWLPALPPLVAQRPR